MSDVNELELATHIVNQSSLQNEEEKDEENIHSSIDINLGNAIKREQERYKYHNKIWIIFIFTVVLCWIGWNHTEFKGLREINITVCVLTTMLCLYGLLDAKYKSQKNNNMNKSMANYLNVRLDIPDTGDDVFDIERKYYGLTYILFVLFHSIVQIIFASAFFVTWNDYDHLYQLMILREISTTRWSLLGWTCFLCAGCYFSVADKCAEKVKNEKQNILNRYKASSIQSIDDNICNIRLKQWEESKQLYNRKLAFCVDICLAIFVRFGTSYIADGAFLNILAHNKSADSIDPQYSIFVIFLGITEAILLSIAFFHIHGVLIYHYHFIYVIMDELSSPIQSKSIYDIIAWWELRKFYLFCIIDLYEGFSAYIVGVILGSLFLIIRMYIDTIPNEKNDEMIISGALMFYGVFMTFKCTTLCVSYHNCQLSHINTINKEKLQIIKYESNYYTSTYIETEKIFDIIHQDILENSTPLSLVTVKMNANFVLFLRATVITGILAVVIEFGA